MARTSIYVNTMGQTEEAFRFYADVFGSQLSEIQRFGSMPSPPGAPGLPEADLDKVLHVSTEILGGTELMGTDMLESLGHELRIGNNTTINLQPDTHEEGLRLYERLSEGSTECVAPSAVPWGGWWGVALDRYGVRWMFSLPDPA